MRKEIEERLEDLNLINVKRISILKTIFRDLKYIQKKLTNKFPTRFRWISKLSHFDDYYDKYHISFQIMDQKISLKYEKEHYVISMIPIKDKDKLWLNEKMKYFYDINEFEDNIEKYVRKNIPEYDKILSRIEKFNRLVK